MADDLFKQAVALAQAGKKDQALPLLQKVLVDSPRNELAWLWLADCQPTLDQRIQVLETLVKIAPEAKRAQAGLAALRKSRQDQAGPAPTPEAQPRSPAAQQEPPARQGPPAYQPPAVPANKDFPLYHSPVAPSRSEEKPAQPPASTEPAQTPSLPLEDTLFTADKMEWGFHLDEEEPETGALAYDTPEEETQQSINESAGWAYDPLAPAEKEEPPAVDASSSPFSEDEDEWPALRQQVHDEPWMIDAAGEAGFGPSFDGDYNEIDVDALLSETETKPPPARSEPHPRQDSGLPAEMIPPPPAQVGAFTVPIDNITEDEFARIEQRTEAALQSKPVIRPLKAQQKQDAARPPKTRQTLAKKKTSTTQVVIFLIIAILGLFGIATLLAGLILSRGGF